MSMMRLGNLLLRAVLARDVRQTDEQSQFLEECHDDLARCLTVPVHDINERRRRCLCLVYNLTEVDELEPYSAKYQKILFNYGVQALRAMLFSLQVFYGIPEAQFVWKNHEVYKNDKGAPVARPRPKEKEVKYMTEANKSELRRWLVLSHLDMLGNRTLAIPAADLAIKFAYWRGHKITMISGEKLDAPPVNIDGVWRKEMMEHALTALIGLAAMVSHHGDGLPVKLGSKKAVRCGCSSCTGVQSCKGPDS